MEQLGDAAIAMLDTGLELDRQVDFLISALDTVPDHEKLHQVLADVCREAAKGFVPSATGDVLDDELEDADVDVDSELGGPGKTRGPAAD
jgi:hypothetical protein